MRWVLVPFLDDVIVDLPDAFFCYFALLPYLDQGREDSRGSHVVLFRRRTLLDTDIHFILLLMYDS